MFPSSACAPPPRPAAKRSAPAARPSSPLPRLLPFPSLPPQCRVLSHALPWLLWLGAATLASGAPPAAPEASPAATPFILDFAQPPHPWRDALDADPANAAVWQLAADIRELEGKLDAVQLRQQVVVSEPDQPGHRLALLYTALRFGELPLAEQTLADLRLAAIDPDDYTEAAAAVAWVQGYPDSGDELLRARFAQAAEPLPLHSRRALQRLRFGSAKDAAAARRELRALADRFGYPVLLRPLIADAVRNNDLNTAAQLGDVLAQRAGAPFTDQLLRANLALLRHPEQLTAACRPLAARSAAVPEDAATFARWLIARGHAAAARRWLESLPASTGNAAVLQAARADCLVALRDPAAPPRAAAAWSPALPPPPPAAGERLPAGADAAAWGRSLRDLSADLPTLRALHRFAVAIGSDAAREAVLLEITRREPADSWAFQALADLAQRQKNTAKLLDTFAQWHAADPANIAVEGRLLMLRLLTARRASPELRATLDDRAMHHPRDAQLANARAFALFLQGRTAEALAVSDTIPVTERRAAYRAFYHGLFAIAGRGQIDEAENYLALSAKADLLPEEAKLVRMARAMIARAQLLR